VENDRVDLDFALARFDGRNAASDAYYAAGGRAGPSARWPQQVGFVEHHHNDHLVLRGTFAGHYVDMEEGHHVSEGGTLGGFAGGMVLGACLGPAGMAAGAIAGATIGSQVGQPTETEAQPQELADRIREAVPRSWSAIVLIAPASDVDEMLAAIGDGADVLRRSLTPDEVAALESSLGGTPAASPGPTEEGEVASEEPESQ
jgi:uncharacterized membrane protein